MSPRKLTYEAAENRVQTATINSVIRSLPLEYLLCRIYRHAFPPPRPDAHWEWDEGRAYWYTDVECPTCTTRKHRAMDGNGYNVITVPYYYPPDYQHGEVNLVTREGLAACRREYQRRMGLAVAARKKLKAIPG